MSYTATLIADPTSAPLTEDMVKAAGDVLAVTQTIMLSPGAAVRFAFDADEGALAQKQAGLAAKLGDAPIDIAVQSADKPFPKLFLADMDSTMIGQECIDELGAAAGLGDRIAAVTERAMRGELDFEAALTERVALLKGLPETALQEVFDARITFTPGAKTLLATLKAKGVETALVSGGFTFFTERVAAALGFDRNHANQLEVKDGALTGRVIPPILGQDAKEQRLRHIADEIGCDLSETAAVGDGANDAAMVKAAGTGFAYHAKTILADVADVSLKHGDLTALLYVFGVPQADFVTP